MASWGLHELPFPRPAFPDYDVWNKKYFLTKGLLHFIEPKKHVQFCFCGANLEQTGSCLTVLNGWVFRPSCLGPPGFIQGKVNVIYQLFFV